MLAHIVGTTLLLHFALSQPFYLIPKLCRTDECLQLGSTVYESIDETFLPCEDFYKFSCNGWISKTSKPAHSLLWNQWQNVELTLLKRVKQILQNGKYNTEYFTKVKEFYNSCINRDKFESYYLEELKLLIHKIGGWPIYLKTTNKNYNWLYHLAEITKLLQVHPIIKLKVDVDILNTNNTILYIAEGDTVLPLQILTEPKSYIKEIQAYKRWIYQSFKHIYKNNLPHDINKQIMEIIEFEMRIARIISIFHGGAKRTALNKLQNKEFFRAFRILLSGSKHIVNKDSKIIIENELGLRQMLHLLHKTDSKIIANYLNWYLIKELSRDTTSFLRNLNFMINKAVFGITVDIETKEDCTKYVMDHLGFSLMKIYSDLYISENVVPEIDKMIINIRNTFESTLKKNDWLNKTTKASVVEKIKNLKYFIGQPFWTQNNTLLEDYYKELKISENHFLNVLQVRQFNYAKKLDKLLQSTNKLGWWLKPFEINAGYSILMNAMIIPLGMLEKPFFDLERPSAFNYGSLGYIIGHELSHSLDDKGRRANQQGQIKNWWHEKDIKLYNEQIECFKKQYDEFDVNSQATIGENIADNIGLNISWAAYLNLERKTVRKVLPKLEFYTEEQLFFISYAQTWCEIPSNNSLLEVAAYAAEEIRVLTSIYNNLDFKNVFNCRKQNKGQCTLW